jgi:hypothetical protein
VRAALANMRAEDVPEVLVGAFIEEISVVVADQVQLLALLKAVGDFTLPAKA